MTLRRLERETEKKLAEKEILRPDYSAFSALCVFLFFANQEMLAWKSRGESCLSVSCAHYASRWTKTNGFSRRVFVFFCQQGLLFSFFLNFLNDFISIYVRISLDWNQGVSIVKIYREVLTSMISFTPF